MLNNIFLFAKLRLMTIFDSKFLAIFGQVSNCHYTDKVKIRHFEKATKLRKKSPTFLKNYLPILSAH